jgi:hypothetical protein
MNRRNPPIDPVALVIAAILVIAVWGGAMGLVMIFGGVL